MSRLEVSQVNSRMTSYAIAIATCLIALPVAEIFDAQVSCFLLAVITTSLFGSHGAGYSAAGICSVLFEYPFSTPRFQFAFDGNSHLRLAAFVIAAFTIPVLFDIARRAQEIRLRGEVDFRALFETCPDAILLLDRSGHIATANLAATALFGYAESVLQGRSASLLLPDFTVGKSLYRDFEAVTAAGQRLQLAATIGFLADKTTVFLRDVSDRRRVEAELRASKENLRQMQAASETANRTSTVAEIAASVVHEVSQPLSAIVTNAQATIRYLGGEPVNLTAVKDAVQRILSDGKDASQIVRNIRAFFRGAGPGRTPIDLRSVIGEVLLLLNGEVREFEINVKVSVEDSLPLVPGHKLQIQQVLVNLVSNAIEAMSGSSQEERELEVRAYEEKNMVLTEVADRGPGLIDAEKVFEAFFTTKQTGMGMGLCISKTIIEAHEGRLWATPREDRGAVFSFALPIAGRAA